MPDHKITTENTCWIFVCGSVELRHFFDIAVGVDCLRGAKVQDNHFYIFSDYPEIDVHAPQFSINQNIYPTSQLNNVLSKLQGYSHAILIIGGHGCEEGVSTQNNGTISPTTVLEDLRCIPELKSGIIISCQCYAGIFNYTPAGHGSAEIVIVGATNLNPSLSATLTLNEPIQRSGTTPLVSWQANIFSFFIMLWFKKPVDIDGDGHFTIMDAYKFAGSESNKMLRRIKSNIHPQIPSLEATALQARVKAQQAKNHFQTILKELTPHQQKEITELLENLTPITSQFKDNPEVIADILTKVLKKQLQTPQTQAQQTQAQQTQAQQTQAQQTQAQQTQAQQTQAQQTQAQQTQAQQTQAQQTQAQQTQAQQTQAPQLDPVKQELATSLAALLAGAASKDQFHTLMSDSADKRLEESLDHLYLHQEPWVLHSTLAREIYFWAKEEPSPKSSTDL